MTSIYDVEGNLTSDPEVIAAWQREKIERSKKLVDEWLAEDPELLEPLEKMCAVMLVGDEKLQ